MLDSIESQFNGVLTTFDLRYSETPTYPTLATSLIVSLGGVLQEPGEAYYVSSDRIVFSEAPLNGTECWILLYSEFGASQTGTHSALNLLTADDHLQYLHVSNTRAGITSSISTTGDLGGANLALTGELRGPAILVIDPAAIGNDTGLVRIKGGLEVLGATTTISSVTLEVADKNIVIGATTSPTDALADGGGITLKGTTDKTFAWLDATDAWTSSERLSVPLGIAGAPSLTFTGDLNTGIYSPGADQVAVATNGTQRLTVDTAATTSTLPVVHPLGAVGTPSITFTGDLNTGFYSPGADTLAAVTAGNNRLHITSTGLVGIGISDPGALLTLGTNGPKLEFNDGDAATDNKRWQFFTGSTSFGLRALTDAGAGGGNQFSFTRSNENINSFQGLQNGAAWFHVDNSTARVGIGTTSPLGFLHIESPATTAGWQLRLDSVGLANESGFYRSAADNYEMVLRNGLGGLSYLTNTGGASTATLEFNVQGSERARITSAGLVGIGTTGPTTNIEVVGVATTDTEVNYALLRGPGSTQPGIYFGGNSTTASTGATARYGYIRSESLGGTARALYLQTGTDTRVVIDNTGKVGIGTTSPGAALHISNGNDSASGEFIGLILGGTNPSNARTASLIKDTTTFDLIYRNNNFSSVSGSHVFRNGNSEHARIDSSGRLLVGTSSAFPVRISTTAITPQQQLAGTNGTSSTFVQGCASTTDTTAASHWFAKFASSTINDNTTAVNANEVLGTITWSGSDGTNQTQAAHIRCEVDGTPGADDMPGRLVFSTTADGASSPTERLRIRSDGNIGIGGIGNAAVALYNQKDITGSTTAYANWSVNSILSDVTTSAYVYRTQITTAAAAFTVANAFHYVARQLALGAGSVITNQYGFQAENSLTGATNNYGFHGNIAAATGRWNFYAAGTANNYFAGNVGIGTSLPDSTFNVRAGANSTAAEEIASFSRPDAAVRAAISKGLIGGTTNGIALGTTTNHPFALNTNGSERLYITNAGNVGIGTTSPGSTLTVNGTARVQNAASFAGINIQNNNDSSVVTTTSFLDASNNLGTIDGHLFFEHLTTGGCNAVISTTPAGDRAVDRRVARLTIGATGTTTLNSATSTAPFIAQIAGLEAARIDSSGRLLVGMFTATGNAKLQVNGDVLVQSINNGPLAGFRNAIINGNFDHWQRGTSFTGNEYGADRWFHNRVGTTATATRQAFTLGQTDVPGEPTYYCRTVVSSVAGAGNAALLVQKLEDARTFAGQQITVSFWAKVDATKNIAVELAQDFGTGGSPSTRVTAIGVTKISIGTNWQKVTVTATLPSISGKTLGTNNDGSLTLLIWFDAGSTFNSRTGTLGQQSGTFEIAQVQVEPGPVATPFERRPIGTELALCQRYFYKTEGLILREQNFASITKDVYFTFFLPQTMRVAPVITATGDINDGASFTTWDLIVGNSAREILLAKSSISSLAFVDISALTASAEL